jgi:ATP-dependent helicase/nuclease subunit A
VSQDDDARVLARTVFDRPVSLEAGAGTGKTTTLVARLVAWLSGPGWEDARARCGFEEPARIARAALRGCIALTFTDAAAAEMQERLTLALAGLAAGTPPKGLPREELPSEAEVRAAALRDALAEPLAVTIHTFARGLLARFPIEAGLQPGFAVDAEGRERERVVRELVEETLASVLARDLDERWAGLFREHVAPQDLGPVLLELCATGATERDLAAARYDAPGIARWRAELGAALAAALALTRPFSGAKHNTGPLHDLLGRLAGSLAEFAGVAPAELERWIREAEALCPENLLKKLGEWGRGKFGKNEQKLLGEAREAAAEACASLHAQLTLRLTERPQLFEHARAALGPLLGEARARLRADNVLGFQDLLLEARELLRNPRVRRTLQAEIRQLSVDEFQDTDSLQCELIEALALDPEARQRPALFLVGDPKQSIYAWRNADLAAYEGFLERLAPLGGEQARLTLNFRSTESVLHAVAHWVGPRMQPEPGLQPRFEPLVAERIDAPAGPALELWIPWDPAALPAIARQRTPAQRAGAIEAAMLVHDLEERRALGVPWKECAVLVRSRSSIPAVLEALRARGIPHEVSGDRSYYRRREIIDALSWVAAAIDPCDTIALLGALRSSACGLPDAALPALWAEGFPSAVAALDGRDGAPLERVRATVERAERCIPRAVGGRSLPEGWQSSLLDALETLNLLRGALAERTLAEFFELLRQRTLLEASEAARYQGDWRAENLERLFQRLERWLEEQHGDLELLLALVREDLQREREAEIARPEELETDAVRVLTIHGAKGLEFRHVYLLGLARSPRRVDRKPADFARLPDGSECVLFGIPGPRWHACAARRTRVQAAEEVRTLYVALTRAKDRIVLSGRWRAEPHERAPARPTLLDLLLADADPEWYAAVGAASRGEGELPREEQLLFRLPRAVDLEELAPLARENLPDENIEIAAEAAVSRRELAQARSARPWSRSPSRLADDDEDELRASAPALGREAGSALHRALERWDFSAEPRREIERLARAEPGARVLLERFAAGPLLERFLGAGRRLVARELSFVAAPDPAQASCALVGSIDLVYRDADERLVVVDYKSDAVAGAEAIDERAQHHAPQLLAYARALARALPGEKPPRAELWFLGAGELRILV